MHVAIIGAGVNGICTAIALAERGCGVSVYERTKPFSQTSSRSSEMLHGGIRYLEKGHFKLVREALADRAWWLANARECTKINRFFIPIYKNGSRTRLKLYLGVKFYDYLAGRYSLGQSKYHDKKETLLMNSNLSPNELIGSVSYLDVQMDDVALSNWLLNKVRSMGVEVISDTDVESITLDGKVVFSDGSAKGFSKVVNACGPWAAKLFSDSNIQSNFHLTLVRGSHLLVDRVLEYPLVFQVPEDGRVVFMLPQGNRALIGTTEVRHNLAEEIIVSRAEIDYLVNSVNLRINCRISEKDVIDAYAGIRPIVSSQQEVADVSSANRESSLELNRNVVSIFGGKWTSAIRLGQSVADMVLSKN